MWNLCTKWFPAIMSHVFVMGMNIRSVELKISATEHMCLQLSQ